MNKIERKIHTLDANSLPLGRMASQIAILLQGKHKKEYTPNVDIGDFVVVNNAKNVILTGKKNVQKKYYAHSQFLGGLKVRTFRDVFEKNPTEIITSAVYNMLPNNRLRKKRFLRLKVNV